MLRSTAAQGLNPKKVRFLTHADSLLLAGQLFPREPTARRGFHNVEKSATIAVLVFPSVEPIRLLIQVAVKVERRAVNVCGIEFRDADESDYETLNFGMEVEGFSLAITSSNGNTYYLPQAEFYREDDSTLDQILQAAKSGAAKTEKEFAVIVSEMAGCTWRGLRRVT